MAKRKHSTALFEVITQPKSYAPLRERRPRTDGFMHVAGEWLKRHVHPTPGQRASSVLVGRTGQAPVAPRDLTLAMPRVTPLIETEAAALHPSDSGAAYDVQEMAQIAEHTPDYFEPAEYADTPVPHPASAHTVALALDHERRQISLRFSYTAATVGTCALALVVSLAIIAGQHINRTGVPLLAQTTSTKLREGPSHPEVLEPARHIATGPMGAASSTRINRPAVAPDAHPPLPEPLSSVPASDGKRYIGLNYVIIQSYPLAEEKMARDAAAFLNKENISCTIETEVKGYLPITVVGLQGFDKISTPPFMAYVKRIQQLSAKYATNNKSYKAFSPVAKSWGK